MKSFIEQLLDLDFPYTKDQKLNQLSRNERYLCMWTEIMDASNSRFFKRIQIDSIEFVRMKLEEYKDIVSSLAEVIDHEKRTALSIASSECKKVFDQCMNFLGQYEFYIGPPEHKSTTSLIVCATDHKLVENVFIPKFNEFKNEEGVMTKDLFEDCFNEWDLEIEGLTFKRISSISTHNQVKYDYNDCVLNNSNQVLESDFITYCSKIFDPTRIVILIFMKNEDQYRGVKKLDLKFVLSIIHQPENNTYEDIISAAIQSSNHKHLKDTEYKFLLVLPVADRSLLDVILKTLLKGLEKNNGDNSAVVFSELDVDMKVDCCLYFLFA